MVIFSSIPGDRGRIEKRPIRDQLSDKLSYMIHSGLLRPGDELPSQRELASTLGVARETVRAAIGVLQARRMIETSQRTRTRVLGTGALPLYESVSRLRKLRDRSFGEVTEARTVVEVQVVALAAQRITKAELARLASAVNDQEHMLGDPVRFQNSDREFHVTLYGACRNKLLIDVISDFYDYALVYRRIKFNRPGAIARSVAGHRDIVKALKTKSSQASVAAIQQHLGAGQQDNSRRYVAIRK